MIKLVPPERGQDSQGSGEFGAPRGNRKHNGRDYGCLPKSKILSISSGEVTKIGYPYNPNDTEKGHLRYVQVTDSVGIQVRYFYVNPLVKLGDKIGLEGVIGESQDLRPIYQSITPHFHLEVKHEGAFIDPNIYIKGLQR